MASIRPRVLADGTERFDVNYSHNDRAVSVTFADRSEAEGFAHVVRLGHRRCWSVAPLVERTGLSVAQLAEAHGLGRHGATDARCFGLTDVQADHWATAAGLHPASVWGWDWVTTALPERSADGEAVA